jgi:hypothetical protein
MTQTPILSVKYVDDFINTKELMKKRLKLSQSSDLVFQLLQVSRLSAEIPESIESHETITRFSSSR